MQVAVLRLVLCDDASPLAGREFEVELPSPRNGQAEFVVLRARFEAALRQEWRVRDRCKARRPPRPGAPVPDRVTAASA